MKTKVKSIKSGSNKKQRQKKIIATAIAVGAAGILGYFGWQYWKKSKGSKGADLDEALRPFPASTTAITNEPPATSNIFIPKPVSVNTTVKPKAANASGFPLKKKSKGEKVRQLQEALIAKHGPSILPRYGADGDFGTETANALKKLGLPASIDQNTFNVLVEGTTSAAADPATLGKELFTAASANDFNKVQAILKKIQDTQEYTAANEVFKTLRLKGGVRQTIVNGLLNTFKKSDQKEKIKYEFLRMGLQYDGSKWSLSGLDGLPIITIIPTTVWVDANRGVKVPARMVLGNEVSRRLDYTLFQNKGKYFLVQTKCIKPL